DIAHNPFERGILISALVAAGGLILSLFVPRRRVWVRVRSTADGAVLEVAGLARSDDPTLEADVHALASKLSTAQDGPLAEDRSNDDERLPRAAKNSSEGSA